MTIARRDVNRSILQLAYSVPGKTLFVGVDPKWDYREYFLEYYTLDIREDRKPDIVGDIKNCIQIPSNSFDAVIMTGVYEYLTEAFMAFIEIHRILKPDGTALICAPTRAYYADKPVMEVDFAFHEIKPLKMTNMNITWYRNKPYYLEILAKK